MALFILSIAGLLATAALLWCLAGFSRTLNQKPKVIGLLVRVGNNKTGKLKRHMQRIIPFPERGSLPRQAGNARFRKYSSLSLLFLAGFALSSAFPGTNPKILTTTTAGFHWNSKIQKTVFVDFPGTRVQRDS